MQTPLEITFQNVDRSEWSESFIHRQVERLERYADDIIACRVTVTRPHRHQQSGNPYHVRVEVTLPLRKELVAVAEPVEVPALVELRTVIRDAFKAMERQLIKAKDLRRGDVKLHEQETALVVRLFPDAGYGFLKRPDDEEEIYFHRHSVLHDEFGQLAVGTEVRYEEESGDKGPQASSVQIISKPGGISPPP